MMYHYFSLREKNNFLGVVNAVRIGFISSERGSVLKGKKLLPKGANSFYIE